MIEIWKREGKNSPESCHSLTVNILVSPRSLPYLSNFKKKKNRSMGII